MIGPETRGAIPMMFARDTASSVRGCRSFRPQAQRLKTNARPSMIKPRIRTKKRLNFPAPRFRPDSVDMSGFAFGLVFIVYLAKKQNQTEMLKIRIRLTLRRKPQSP